MENIYGASYLCSGYDDNEEDYYSPTGWEQEENESDEDYADRLEDLNNYLESLD